jgi:hypothetical protein
MKTSSTIFDFNQNSNIQDWKITNDIVMGGKSSSSFTLNTDGFGVFSGTVSLENNGGFSSVRYQFEKIKVNNNAKIIIKLKGDGKTYQLRVKDDSGNYYSYTASFSTTGKWQEIEIPLKDMYPYFRGYRINRPNFSSNNIDQITFLIGNKTSEKFKLLIDKIEII